MNLLVFGLGYSTSWFARHHAGPFSRIAGTTRSGACDVEGAEALAFDGQHADARLLAAIAEADALLVSIPPATGPDPVLAACGAAIARSARLRAVVYLSTIGVYGDRGGAWVDESMPPAPTSPRTRARVAAEQGWLALHRNVHVLRLAGIYGPGRNALVNLREGTARRIAKPGQVFNRIHVEDIARAIAAALEHRDGGVWNVADSEPAPPQEVIAHAAALLGMPPPPEVPFGEAEMTPMARSFYAENKRVSNRRLLEQLGVTLAYPTYREGLAALAREMKA